MTGSGQAIRAISAMMLMNNNKDLHQAEPWVCRKGPELTPM